MPKLISPQVAFPFLLAETKRATPEIFDHDGQFLNLFDGRWQERGTPRPFTSAVDGTLLGSLPMLDHDTALKAVVAAKKEAAHWAATDLDERRRPRAKLPRPAA